MKKNYLILLLALGLGQLVFAQGDHCSTAAIITGSGTYNADGPSSGFGVDTTCNLVVNPQHADWYRYTPSFSGLVEITSCIAGGVDTQVSVLTGTCGALTCIDSNDDGCNGSFSSYVQISVTAGQDYYIQWDDGWSELPFQWQLLECVGSVLGTTYLDQNSNGAHDVGEPLKPVMLAVNPGGYNNLSNGSYAFCSDLGSYDITVTDPPLYHTTFPTTQSYTIVNQGDQATGMDFAFQPMPGIYDATVNIWGWNAWIGNNTGLYINYANIGTEPIDGDIQLTLDGALSFVSADVTPDNLNGQTISWNIAVMAPGTNNSIYIEIYTDSTTAPNAPILNTVIFNTVQTDVDPASNIDDMHVIASTSFDPNEKLVETETISPSDVADGRAIEYTVHFQNTGNAPAVNIVVRDSLDSDWDVSSFEMIDASHPYNLSVNDEVAIWTFANIFLPDSATDQEGSNGGFHYRMTPKSTLMLGDELTNRADIYFDFNAPVLTNTTVTTVSESTDILETVQYGNMVVFPIPTTGNITLQWNGETIKDADLLIIDAMGRTVFNSTDLIFNNGQQMSFDLADNAEGLYTLLVIGKGSVTQQQFILAE